MIMSFISAAANSSIVLLISRLIQGIGSAMMVSTSTALLVSEFPQNERGKILGYSVSATYLGLASSPLLGGLMTEAFGWRSVFLLNGIITLFIFLGFITKIKTESSKIKLNDFDFLGSIILLISITSLMYGLSKIPEILNILLAIVGIFGLVIFVYVERKKTNPILNINLFSKNKTFSFANLTALINYSSTFAITFVLSLYLQNVRGLTPKNAGLILIAQPIMMTIVSFFSGKMSDKKDPRILASFGMALISIGLFLFTFLSSGTSSLYIILCLLLLGFGFGMFTSPNTNSAMSSVGSEFYAVASATLSTMRSVGMMFSMAIVAMTTYIFIGNQIINYENIDEYMKSVKVIFVVFALLCVVGVFTSLVGRTKK